MRLRQFTGSPELRCLDFGGGAIHLRSARAMLGLNRKRTLGIVGYGVALVAVVLAAKAAHSILDAPAMYTGIGSDQQPTHASLVQINGEGAISTVQFPVALTLIALVLPWRKVRIAVTILLWVFVILAGMTIGFYYFPAAVALLIATSCWVTAAKIERRPDQV
jgi:hypothetical protein